jgi:predicted transcriptional regulator
MKLSPTAKGLLEWMTANLAPGQTIRHSNAQLAAIVGCTDRSIRRALRQLSEHGVVGYQRLVRYDSSGAGYRELVFVGTHETGLW